MRIRHTLPGASARAEIDHQVAVLQRNQLGDLLYLWPDRQTRYGGWSVWNNANKQFTRILEHVSLPAAGNVVGITNTGPAQFFEYANGCKLGLRTVASLHGLTLTTSTPTPITLTLDPRSWYEFPTFGRQIGVVEDPYGNLITCFDEQTGTLFSIHIRADAVLSLSKKWISAHYVRDQLRRSQPTDLFVYELGTTEATRIALGYGATPDEARRASLAASKQRPKAPFVGISHSPDTLITEVTAARAAATLSLRQLQTQDGMFAGLPWFHQVWARDSLISAIGLPAAQQRELSTTTCGTQLIDGKLPTFLGAETGCSDGALWFSLLVQEFGVQNLGAELSERVTEFLTRMYDALAPRRSPDGLIPSGHNGTWMDTAGRSGYPLEVQAGYSCMLGLLHTLTGNEVYARDRARVLSTLQQHYWNGSYLDDSRGDSTIRPNVFIAYLAESELLTENQWIRCFETALAALRMPWGGLASRNQHDQRFQQISTGEDNVSYHEGDSWFFVNNLAAVALRRCNQGHFGKVITGILESSVDELLWFHCIGHAGEISSAGTLDSWGCGAQAFSAGTFLFLLHELEADGSIPHPGHGFW